MYTYSVVVFPSLLWCIEAAQVKIPHLISNTRNSMHTIVKFQRHTLVHRWCYRLYSVWDNGTFSPTPIFWIKHYLYGRLDRKTWQMRFKDLKGNSKIIQTPSYIRQKKNSDFQFIRRIVRYGASALGCSISAHSLVPYKIVIPGYSLFRLFFCISVQWLHGHIYFFKKASLWTAIYQSHRSG